MKRIDARYNFIRDIVADGDIFLKKIDTRRNLAYMLTKLLLVAKFKLCLDLLHVRERRAGAIGCIGEGVARHDMGM